MKNSLLILIFSCIALATAAQEKIKADTISVPKAALNDLTPQISMPLFSGDESLQVGFPLFDASIFSQPLLPDYSKNLDFSKYIEKYNTQSYSFSPAVSYFFNPFLTNETIFNQSIYRLNNRLSIGGNSFGARSVFDKPVLNPAIEEMNIRGASMFMQYKVSDKFKIETRVSISNGRSPLLP